MKTEGDSVTAPPDYAELLRLLDSQVEQHLNLKPAATPAASGPQRTAEPPAPAPPAAVPRSTDPLLPIAPTATRALVLHAATSARPIAARSALVRIAWRALPALLCVAFASSLGWALLHAPSRPVAKSSPQPPVPTTAPTTAPTPVPAPDAAPQAPAEAVAAAVPPPVGKVTPAAGLKDTSCSAAVTALGLCQSLPR